MPLSSEVSWIVPLFFCYLFPIFNHTYIYSSYSCVCNYIDVGNGKDIRYCHPISSCYIGGKRHKGEMNCQESHRALKTSGVSQV